MTHESTSYFERCYATDLEERASIEDKRLCWAAWLEHYTTGQPPDRVRYAEDRLAALARGESQPPLRRQAAAVAPAAPIDAGVAPPVDASVAVVSDASVDAIVATDASVAATDGAVAADGAVAVAADAAVAVDPNAPPPRRPWQRRPVVPPPPALPAAGHAPCRPVCDPKFNDCIARCGDRGTPCHHACKAEYQGCMQACP
jgi:hypothetical protein